VGTIQAQFWEDRSWLLFAVSSMARHKAENTSTSSNGELTTITDPLNHVTTLTYTSAGLIGTVKDAQNNLTTYQYDGRGNRTAVIDPINGSAHPTSFTYDLMDRLTKTTYPDGTHVDIGYDYRGRRTTVTDQNGKITTYAYDDEDRLVSVTDAQTPNPGVTSYVYDTENQLQAITDANNHTTTFHYDNFGRVTQTDFPSSLSENFYYDAVGNLTSKTDRNGHTITYVYDNLNRMTSKSYTNYSAAYSYDLDSRITKVVDPTGTYGFVFDYVGRLIGVSTQYSFLPGTPFAITYSYDSASNRVAMVDPQNASTTYGYDTLNRLTSLLNPVSPTPFGFNYDALSRRTQMTRPNGINTNYNYDGLAHLLSVLHQVGTSTPLDGATYSYDNAGNRLTRQDNRTDVTATYGYDTLYQLTSASGGSGESYTYDPAGNRLTSASVPNYVLNSSNEVTSTSNATYTYDNNGNTATKVDSSGTTTYSWDFEDRLTQVTLPALGGTVNFKYDPFGRRIQKVASLGGTTTTYVLDGENILEEVNAVGTVTARYTMALGVDEPLAATRGVATSFYEADGLGSITSLTDASSTITNTYTYDAFGRRIASTGTVANPFQYAAREFDSETGSMYYRARYYSPDTGRFLSEDPAQFGTGENLYPYVGNSPTNFVDPSGLQQLKPQPLPLPRGKVIPFPKPYEPPLPFPRIPWWIFFADPNGSFTGWELHCADVVDPNCAPASASTRGNSDPIPYPGISDPGREPCKPGQKLGDCKACPPDTPYWKQPGNAHGGTAGWHTHWYTWNQDPKTCKCYPKRMSGGSQP
jgi:RHS repeat-associated protein